MMPSRVHAFCEALWSPIKRVSSRDYKEGAVLKFKRRANCKPQLPQTVRERPKATTTAASCDKHWCSSRGNALWMVTMSWMHQWIIRSEAPHCQCVVNVQRL